MYVLLLVLPTVGCSVPDRIPPSGVPHAEPWILSTPPAAVGPATAAPWGGDVVSAQRETTSSLRGCAVVDLRPMARIRPARGTAPIVGRDLAGGVLAILAGAPRRALRRLLGRAA